MASFSIHSPFLASPSSPLSSTLPYSSPSFLIHRPFPHRHRCRCILAVRSSSNLPKPPKPQTLANYPTPLLDLARNPLSILIFSLSLAFLPFPSPKIHAIAAPSAATSTKSRRAALSLSKEHEFSGYTKDLLVAVRSLLERINDVKNGKGGMNAVYQQLEFVKGRRKVIQEEILEKLNSETRVLRREKGELVKRTGEILESAMVAKREIDRVLKKEGENIEEVKGEVERLERVIEDGEKEYNGIWEKVGEIEDRIMRKETMVLSVAIRELGFIERESELLVERFSRKLREKNLERYCFSFLDALFLHLIFVSWLGLII